ncbi:MAG: hypothetical protein ACRC44_08525 [Bifidobacterium asteroides]
MSKPDQRYEIEPRPAELGGGDRLRLIEDDEEVGGGVFPADPDADPHAGVRRWNDLEEAERRRWMQRAGDTGRAVDAYAQYLIGAAHDDAVAEGESWLASR